MSSDSTIYLTLPRWDGGSRKIRYIYLVDVTSFRLTQCPNRGPAAPLFLGADLFSNTEVRTENHPRYHAKFAKKGLATKIHFSSAFRFHGLKVPTASNSLWFYSVQGLFRVAFEMYSKREQLAVLENFQDVWKSQMDDDPLKASYSLSAQVDLDVCGGACEGEPRTEVKSAGRCQVDPALAAERGGNKDGSIATDHDYCHSPPRRPQTERGRPLSSAVRHKLRRLDDELSSPAAPSPTERQLEAALLLLEHVGHNLHGDLEEGDATEAVSALLGARDWGCAYSSAPLDRVARWLGRQFHAANGAISRKVEDFKVQHIEQISELPPAQELAAELFPEAMRTLLLHWMGLSEESSQEKRRSEYPILLLILEFANHNLITGVAHVLYSSLICK